MFSKMVAKISSLRKYFALLFLVPISNGFIGVGGTGTSTMSQTCSGVCTRDSNECLNRGGRVFGSCENRHVCCDLTWKDTGSCGTVKGGKNPVYFASPEYPVPQDEDLVCTFVLNLVEEVVAIRVDFLDVAMDGLGYFRGSSCESDIFVLKGFKTWTPPVLCGNLTGYSILIERTVNTTRMDHFGIVALMSSNGYRWKFKITPYLHRRGFNQNNSRNNTSQNQSKLSHVNPRKSRGKRWVERGGNIEENFVEGQTGEIYPSLENPLITDGQNVTSFEVPWQASLRTIFKEAGAPGNRNPSTTSRPYDTPKPPTNETEAQRQCLLNEGMHFCGGVIISDRHILTAAHCFYAVNKGIDFVPVEEMKVVLGDTNRCTKESGTQQEHSIESITLHYAYDPVGVMNDVAVVKLKQPIVFKRNVQKIKMAGPDQSFDGERALVSGWGMQNLTEENNGLAESPLILSMNDRFIIRNQSECGAEQTRYIGQPPGNFLSHPKYLHVLDSVICTETHNTTGGRAHVGLGDSGGPLVVKSRNGENENILVGIVSHSIPNANPENVEDPSDFYASVSFYRPWIELAMI